MRTQLFLTVMTAAWLVTSSTLAHAEGVAPVIKQGAATSFRLSDLTGNSVGKLVASDQYQVSVVFPYKVQSIGVNALKQAALMTTIDQYDKRVIYLDTLQAGGTATVNVRLLNPTSSHPLILKFYVELTGKSSGVLTYGVQAQPARPATPVSQPTKPVQASKPVAPKPGAAVATVKPPNAAQPQTPPVNQAKSIPPAAPSKVIVQQQAVPKYSIQTTQAKRNHFQGSNSAMRVEAVLDRASDRQNVIVNYTITVKPGKTAYSLPADNISLRLGSERSQGLIIPTRSTAKLNEQQPLVGKLLIDKTVFSEQRTKVLLFNVQNTAQKGKTQFLGVVLR